MTIMSPIAVLGAGSWGTALALHLSRHDQVVHLWDNDVAHIESLQIARQNKRHLPGINFPENLKIFKALDEALHEIHEVLLVIPSQFFHSVLLNIQPLISNETPILWATKGIDPETNQLFDQVVETVLGKRPMAVLSGPSFATEVAQGLPTAICVASHDETFAKVCVKRFNHEAFRVYTSDDLIGVQLGGAAKNVIAIATGASDGLHYGANARSALITRGLAEITRLGLAMGAKPHTFMGLSVLGDLVLTCTDDQSRNRRLGLAIAEGTDAARAEQAMGQVTEGAYTVKQVVALAQQYHIEMPISEQVFRVLNHEISLKDAVQELLSRSPKSE